MASDQNRALREYRGLKIEVAHVLTEKQIESSFRQLFQAGTDITPDLLDKADGLIDQLRLESPLRHRLSEELEELRELAVARKS